MRTSTTTPDYFRQRSVLRDSAVTYHWRANTTWVARRLLPRHLLNSGIGIGDHDSSRLRMSAVLTAVVQILTSPLSSKKHSLVPLSILSGPTARSLIVRVLPLSIEIVISSPIVGFDRKYRVGTTLEHISLPPFTSRTNSPKIPKLLNKALELVKHLRVHAVTRHIVIVDVLAILLLEFCLDLLEVQRLHA